MNGCASSNAQDSEVAKITAAGFENPQNIVHLKDPKMIEGFGSNVVHVNVSCGQTLPEPASKQTGSRAQSRNQGAEPAADEDEDA